MRNPAFQNQYSPELPKGIQRIIDLPHPELAVLWDSIILCEKIKTQMLSQAILNFTVRTKVDRSVIPLHGVILLVTEHLESRLKSHNRGENPYTAKYKPWQIKTAIAFSDRQRAIDFEEYLKTPSGRAFSKKKALILSK
jgi:hypothetical protein